MPGIDSKTAKRSFLWNAVETYAGQGIQFLISIIMARLLPPSDYGVIGMTTIFTCVAEALIFAGFPTALIRKKKCSGTDYSTVFYFNIVIGIAMCLLMWIGAPYIAIFYNIDVLRPISRVMGGLFIINAIGGVSMTILRKEMRFKEIATITLSTSVMTGAIAIFLAYNGWGVWALVAQIVAVAVLRVSLVMIRAHWWPTLIFSTSSFKELFGFGSKILGSNLIVQIYQNIYSLIIGKVFNAAALGFFTRADGYSKLVPINIAGVIQKTLFPMLSTIQDDEAQLKNYNRKMVGISSFMIFPTSLILAGTAYPVISIMISDKWIATAPLLQILCISVLPDHLYYINNDFISIKGYSGKLMKEQAYSKLLSLGALAASIPFGLKWIAVGKGFGALATYLISAYYLKSAIGIGIEQQARELWLMLIVSLLIGAGNALFFMYADYSIVNLLGALLFSVLLYMGAARVLFRDYLYLTLKLLHR